MTEKEQKDLPERMIVLADSDRLPVDHEMRDAANRLKQACNLYFKATPEMTVFKFVGCYARARRIWCEYTGTPLLG